MVATPAVDRDPAFGKADTMYNTFKEEIVKRAPHDGPHYAYDNARVYELPKDSVVEFPNVYNWISPYGRRKDGRGAWLAFEVHYHGDLVLDGIQTWVENKLQSVFYNGECPKFDFEQLVSIH